MLGVLEASYYVKAGPFVLTSLENSKLNDNKSCSEFTKVELSSPGLTRMKVHDS